MNETMKKVLNLRMLTTLLLGYSAGLPYLLTSTTLQAWMTREGINLKTLGFVAYIGLPYTFKLILAPFLDRYKLPFLGRRKGWMFLFQVGVAVSIFGMSTSDPRTQIFVTVAWAFLVAFFSASQDIVLDAYRREILSDEELGLGSSLYVYGYRTGMWISGGFAFILAGMVSWNQVYFWMSIAMLPSLLFTFFGPQEDHQVALPGSMKDAVIGPLKELLSRKGAYLMLLFVLLYKVGDSVAANMTIPFIIKQGYTDIQIGTVAKTFGIIATMIGGLAGGTIMLKISLKKALLAFGILQALSTFCFAFLITLPRDILSLAAVIGFENIASGMGTAAYAAYMASLTNKKFTVTQYALLTSIMGLTSKIIPGPAGILASEVGWFNFFLICTLLGIPGLLLLIPLRRLERPSEKAAV